MGELFPAEVHTLHIEAQELEVLEAGLAKQSLEVGSWFVAHGAQGNSSAPAGQRPGEAHGPMAR
jgi:hypothetical protein